MAALAPPSQTSTRSGRFILAQRDPEPFFAFHLNDLPPDPPVAVDADLQELLDRANQALGRLDGVTAAPTRSGSVHLLLHPQGSAPLLADRGYPVLPLRPPPLRERRSPGVPIEDVQRTSTYVAAMEHGLERIDVGFPLSLRLLREIHGLPEGRGADKKPGSSGPLRTGSADPPGIARYVPPPPHRSCPPSRAGEVPPRRPCAHAD